MSQLLVLIPDHLSELIEKGETQPRYYNPGNLFRQVTIAVTNDDRPDPKLLQRMVGDAQVDIFNIPERPELTQYRWAWQRQFLLRRWAQPAVDLARRIRPNLIRCHGADWNIYAAARIKATLGIPYVASLHINPDVNSPRRYLESNLLPWQQLHNRFFDQVESVGLLNADLVMPVYRPIIPYLKRLGVERFDVCYNVLDDSSLVPKTDYKRRDVARLVYVGRLVPAKDPSNIIRAVAASPNVHFTIVGDGPLRPGLEALAQECGVADRVEFRPAVANAELCRMLHTFDLFVVHTEHWELSKSVLEAVLAGLPVIINRRIGPQVPEFAEGDFVHMVDNTVRGYKSAIDALLADQPAREALGRRAFAQARANWSPAATEAKYVSIYQRLMLRTERDAA